MSKVRKLCECALMAAMAFLLSLLKIPLPFGGSVTAFSMVPLIFASYRNGPAWGMGTAFVFSLIKLLMGLDNFAYVTGAASFAAVLFFDYLIAYTVIGGAGLLRLNAQADKKKTALRASLGALLAMLCRYLCHIVSGAVVWYDLTKVWEAADPGNMVFRYGKWVYSILYNGAYMIPETVVTVAGIFLLTVSFRTILFAEKER